jgi:hypothetical protein
MSGYQANDLAARELFAMRDESAQAREQQQSILQWSIGGIGLLYAAGISAGGSDLTAQVLRLIGFGLVIPGLTTAASLAWLGEVLRMERVGYYLRGRERGFWKPDASGHKNLTEEAVRWLDTYPTLWENFIAFAARSRARKQLVGYVGGLSLYAGSLVLGVLVAVSLFIADARFDGYNYLRPFAVAYAAVWIFGWMAFFAWQGRNLMKLGKLAAGDPEPDAPN